MHDGLSPRFVQLSQGCARLHFSLFPHGQRSAITDETIRPRTSYVCMARMIVVLGFVCARRGTAHSLENVHSRTRELMEVSASSSISQIISLEEAVSCSPRALRCRVKSMESTVLLSPACDQAISGPSTTFPSRNRLYDVAHKFAIVQWVYEQGDRCEVPWNQR